MKKLFAIAMLFTFFLTSSFTLNKNATLNPEADIVDLAVQTEFLSTLVAAVKAGDLVGVLKGDGPFTVFAPTNEAFAKLPAGTVDNLLKPENKATLTAILTYHVVAGRLDAKEIARLIKEGNGKAELTTVQGGKLWLWMKDKTLWIKDEKGGMASVTIKDVYQSNGVIHVIDAVVLPKG